MWLFTRKCREGIQGWNLTMVLAGQDEVKGILTHKEGVCPRHHIIAGVMALLGWMTCAEVTVRQWPRGCIRERPQRLEAPIQRGHFPCIQLPAMPAQEMMK